MSDSFRSLDLSQLNLDDATRQLFQHLLNHIETLEAELVALRAENQHLRDEVARLKGQKGKPQFKANVRHQTLPPCHPSPTNPAPRREPKPNTPDVPRAERFKIDREQAVSLDRYSLPPDFQSAGYREVIIQNIRFETDNVRYRLERSSSPRPGQFFEARLPETWQGKSFGPELQALLLILLFELRVSEDKVWGLLIAQGILLVFSSIGTRMMTRSQVCLN